MEHADLHNTIERRRLLYHFVWRPMRGKPLLVGPAAERLRDLLEEKAARLDVVLRVIDIRADGVYLAVEAPATLAPHSIVCGLKAHSSGILRREYKEMRVVPTLWTREYLVVAGEDVAGEQLLALLAARHGPRRSRGRPRCSGI